MINYKRISVIIQNSASNLVTPAISMLFSYYIISKYNAELWGGFVYYLIIVNLAAHILGWGNKEYLLREFSRDASRKSTKWTESFVSRIIFLPAIILPYYFLTGSFGELMLMAALTLLLFVYQSFDVIITFERKFMLTVYAEIISFVLLAIIVYFSGVSDTKNLLTLYIYSFIFKPVFLFIYFRNTVFKENPFNKSISFKYFVLAFPFFILGLTGMIQSRIDIYSVGYFLNKESLGTYQVIVNFLGVFQSASIFIVAPFIKDIYRLKSESIRKMNNSVLLSGIALLLPFMVTIYLALTIIYKFNLSADFYIYMALYILPVYYYVVSVYIHYKKGKQNTVIFITLTAIGVGLLSNIFLTPSMGIKGALLSGGISQLFMCGAYYLSGRKINNVKEVAS
jgi:O-antigen/teichoic acid export membrane protein